MAILARFEGRNASGYVEYWGQRFPCGESVLVDGEEATRGVKRHPEFTWQEAADPIAERRSNGIDMFKTRAALTPTEIDAAIAAFDHDGDGKPGGSKRGRRRRKAAE